MEQLDLLVRLEPSRNPLRDASILDIVLGYFDVATWCRHGSAVIFPLEKRKLTIPVVVICCAV